MTTYDVAVLGGGPGGYACAIRCSQYGLRTCLIEESELGGTCLNRGCIPTKALLQSASVYTAAKRAGEFGVSAENIGFSYAKFAARKEQLVRKLRNGIATLEKSHGVTVYQARGALADRQTVSLSSGESIRARQIVLAAGCSPAPLPIPGSGLPGVLDSTGVLALTDCPESVVIIGGGVVGVEFASLFSALGVPVTLLEQAGQILAPLDDMLRDGILRRLTADGVAVHTSVHVRSIEPGLRVTYTGANGTEAAAEGEICLTAGGRTPNTAALGLEQAGVALSARGFIETDGLCRTNAPGIYAVGDVTGKLQLAHAATAQGLLAAAHIARRPCQALDFDQIPSCLYCSPEAAMIGLTEQQARSRGFAVQAGVFPLSGNGKALIAGEAEGFVKLVTDAQTGQILGAHLLAPHATDLIGEIAALMRAEGTVSELAEAVHPHPTVSEALMEAAHCCLGLCVNLPKQN